MSKIKLIASDLDGTLITEGTQNMEPGFFEVLEELLDQGYLFYAASGRQYANMKRVFSAYADRIGFVCENGAVAFENEEQIYIQEVLPEKVQAIASDIMRFPETDICLSGVNVCYIQPRTDWFEDQLLNVLKNECRMFASLEEVTEPIVKIAAYIYDWEKNFPSIQKYFQDKYGNYADFVYGGNGWMDMILKDSGKGRALQAVLDQKGLSPEEIMVFGDNQNDISMLELTKNSYAMTHAKPEIQAHAADTCVSVTEILRTFLKKS